MSSGLRTSVVRPAQYTPARSPIPTAASASAKVTTVPSGTVRPLLRRTRAKATATRSTADAGSASATQHGLTDEVAHAAGPYPFLVLAVLEHRAEGDVDGVLVELHASQGGESGGPVDGLGHPRRLVELHVTQVLDGGRDLAGQPVGHVGRPQTHDLHLPLEIGVLDPVVQAASLEGVVHVPGAVRGHDDDGRDGGVEGAELGDGHRVVREDLQQEGLELVVGPVDLVDQQYR